MRVLVSGASGLVGSALMGNLHAAGHEAVALRRDASSAARGVHPSVTWNPDSETLSPDLFAGFDAVVHLAGSSIAEGRWTSGIKRRIRESRVRGTTNLARSLANVRHPRAALVSASAIGYYGHRGDEELTEESAPGTGFLAEVCQEWEAACAPAAAAGARVVHLRFGMILSPRGGALARMLPLFRLGMGGPLGSGRQFMSWIWIDDAVAAIRHALDTEVLSGPINVVAPEPVRNAEFTHILARVLTRPAILPAPAFALRAALGEMADALLLSSARAIPARLAASGFGWEARELEAALRRLQA